jgi:hypothetical protein
MVSDSSSPTTIPSSFSIPVSKKLMKTNYFLWSAQIMPPIRAAKMEGLLTSTGPMSTKLITVKTSETTQEVPTPEYVKWLARDQALLGYILSSLMHDALMGVTTATTTVATWTALHGMYAPQMCACSVNTCITLATTRKGTTMMAKYFSKMKSYADEMAASDQPLGDEEFVVYVLSGLDEELYNPLVSSIVTIVEPISPPELYSQMISYELKANKQSSSGYSSANIATWDCESS